MTIENRDIVIVTIGIDSMPSAKATEFIDDIKTQFNALYDRVVFIPQRHRCDVEVSMLPIATKLIELI